MLESADPGDSVPKREINVTENITTVLQRININQFKGQPESTLLWYYKFRHRAWFLAMEDNIIRVKLGQQGLGKKSVLRKLTFRRHSDFVGASRQTSVVRVQPGHMTRSVTPRGRTLDVFLIRP